MLRPIADTLNSVMEEDIEFEVTSVDPLNLALTAKSFASKAWWWFITVAAVVGTVAGMGLLIQTFKNKPIQVMIKVSESKKFYDFVRPQKCVCR
jgi:hypothetical protein